jgi:hypothetical protein
MYIIAVCKKWNLLKDLYIGLDPHRLSCRLSLVSPVRSLPWTESG